MTSVLELARKMVAEGANSGKARTGLSRGTPQGGVPWDTSNVCPTGRPSNPDSSSANFTVAATRTAGTGVTTGTGGTAGTGGTNVCTVLLWQRQSRADAYRAEIEAALERLPAPCHDGGRRLLFVTLQFVRSCWLEKALESGWTTLALFGIDNCAPLDLCEHWGLVTGLALAPRLGDRIESIDGERAVIRYRSRSNCTDATRIDNRFSPSEGKVLWWECAEIVNE